MVKGLSDKGERHYIKEPIEPGRSSKTHTHTHLKGTNGGALESKVGLEVLGDLTDETLKR